MFTILNQREVFHITFLRQLTAGIRQNTYAVKGGVNLRLFFGSARYSEDMDIDIKGIELFRLREVVMNILTSKTLQTSLRPFHINEIIAPDMKVAKQTETTQRFKIHLITQAGDDLFTKIEFSRRRLEDSIATETISETILRQYKLPPLLVSHYLADVAILQKIRALAGRAKPQTRDVFDLFVLIPRYEKAWNLPGKIPQNMLERAYHNTLDLNLAVFKDTVLAYLEDEDRNMYDHKEAWEEIQTKVGQFIERLKSNG